MNNEQVAEKISERMHQIIALPSILAEVERLRLIGIGVRQQINDTNQQIIILAGDKKALKNVLLENSNALMVATQQVDDALAALYRPVAAPSSIVSAVAEEAKKRGRKPKEAPASIDEAPTTNAATGDDKTAQRLAILHDPAAAPCAKCHASSECDDCCKSCLSPCNSMQICRVKLAEKTSGPPADPGCQADCEFRNLSYVGNCSAPEDNCCGWDSCGPVLKSVASESAKQEAPATLCPKCEGDGLYIEDGIEDGGGEVYCDCPAGVALQGSEAELGRACDHPESKRIITEDSGSICGDCGITIEEEPAGEEEQVVFLPAKFFAEKGAIPKAFKGTAGIPENGKLVNVFESMGKLFAITGAMYWKNGMENASAYEMIPVALWDGGDTCTVKQRGSEYSKELFSGKGGCLQHFGCQVAWKKEPYILGRQFQFKPENSPTPEPSKEVEKQEVAQPVDESTAQASEVAQPLICANLQCDYSDTAERDNCGVPLSERHGKPIDKCSDFHPHQETTNETAQAQAETEGGEEGTAETVHAGAPEQIHYSPLDESISDCDLCMGYGVIEGEIYGEFTLVPCTCEAGAKVKEVAERQTSCGAVKSPCDKCNIDDPDCTICHLPDMDAPFEVKEPATEPPVSCFNKQCSSYDTKSALNCYAAADLSKTGNPRPVTGCKDFRGALCAETPAAELPECANGACTATGKGAKEVCLRIGQLGRAPKECANFVPTEDCKHAPPKRYNAEDGSLVCGVCGQVLQASRRATTAEPAKPALTKLQQKCVHPKVFRQKKEGREHCRCCDQFLEGGVSSPALALDGGDWDGPRR